MPDKYNIAAISLLAASALFITIALLFKLGDFTKAAFVMSGMVCTMVGIFTWAFSGSEPMDPRLVGILPAQGCINFCILNQFLGIKGNAFFLPSAFTGETRVMQFNPISTNKGIEIFTGRKRTILESVEQTGSEGLVTPPSCDLLIRDLKKRNAMVIPEEEEELSVLMSEAVEDVFKFAQRISVEWRGDKVSVTFHKYPFIDGCKVTALESPECCAMSPCPACSLCGTLIAEGGERIVTLDRCSANSSTEDVTAVFSIVPFPDMNSIE